MSGLLCNVSYRVVECPGYGSAVHIQAGGVIMSRAKIVQRHLARGGVLITESELLECPRTA